MSTQDFSEDITNGDFADTGMENQGGDEEMAGGLEGDDAESAMNQDDSMGGNNGTGNGDDMDSADTGSADQYGKDDDRKLFIGGLSWETTEKDLREYFSKYGSIESLTLKMDPTTGRSRGFAFIVFSEVSSLDKVIDAGDHAINGKKVDPKKAKARHGKIFVGGLTQEISDDDIKDYFSKFGNIVETEMPIDKTKNQRKGFCFITFDNEQVVHELLKTPKQTICGKEVDVKKAQPPQNARGGMMGWGGPMMPSRGGRGSTRGGRGRGGRSDWSSGSNWGGYGSSGYGSSYGGYGQGYGGANTRYGGYDYYGYGGGGYGYDQSYYGGSPYDGYEGYYEPPMRGGGSGSSGGRGRGGSFGGKTRGAPRGQKFTPY